MPLSNEQLEAMIMMISGTCENELSCEECFDGMAQFAERELAGLEKCEAMQAIQAHLDLCPECEEVYNALYLAVKAIESGDC